MDGLLLPILIGGAIILVVFVGWQIVQTAFNPEKRKLKDRLKNEGKLSQAEGANANRSITRQLGQQGLSATLMQFKAMQGLAKMLLQSYPDLTLLKFVCFTGMTAFMFFLIATLVSGAILVGFVAGGVGTYIPFMLITGKRNKRQRGLAEQLPEALDFLSRILRAGHSLSTGIQMMGVELAQPLAAEFARAYDQHSLGLPMEDALKDMATRIESTDFAFFVTAVLIQRTTGGDLSEVLGNISGMIRQRVRLQNNVKAKTAEGRFTGYILSAFPALMFVIASILNPDYASVLWKTNIGLGLLGGAFGLMLMGLFFIKKITTIRV